MQASFNEVNQAQQERDRMVNIARGEYAKAPDITRERLYLERMKEVLPNIKSKIIIDGDTGNAPLPLLHLGGESTQLKVNR